MQLGELRSACSEICGALDRALAGPVADGVDQIHTGGIVLPGIGDQHLGGIE
jgi:hypothetical protein